MFGPPLPTLSDPFTSLTVLAPTIGSAGLTDAPSGGASAASGSYSAALFGLKGNAGRHVLGSRGLLGDDVAGP